MSLSHLLKMLKKKHFHFLEPLEVIKESVSFFHTWNSLCKEVLSGLLLSLRIHWYCYISTSHVQRKQLKVENVMFCSCDQLYSRAEWVLTAAQLQFTAIWVEDYGTRSVNCQDKQKQRGKYRTTLCIFMCKQQRSDICYDPNWKFHRRTWLSTASLRLSLSIVIDFFIFTTKISSIYLYD